jgi:uncharacterized protein YbaR (Trm112 family)
MSMPLSPELLEIIVCPDCHGDLTLGVDTLTCTGCGLVYPIRDGIPVLLVDEATRPTQS